MCFGKQQFDFAAGVTAHGFSPRTTDPIRARPGDRISAHRHVTNHAVGINDQRNVTGNGDKSLRQLRGEIGQSGQRAQVSGIHRFGWDVGQKSFSTTADRVLGEGCGAESIAKKGTNYRM